MSLALRPYNEPPNVGPHYVGFEGDILWVILRGPLVIEQAQRFVGTIGGESPQMAAYFMVIDVQESHTPPEPEARRYLMDWTKTYPPIGTAVIGGNVLMRTFGTLANRALNLLSNRNTPMRFFATPAEGIKWFGELRNKR